MTRTRKTMRSAITTAITDVMDTGSGERGSPIRSRGQNFVTTGAMLDTGWYSLEMCMLQIWHTVLNDAWFSKTKQPASSQNVRDLALLICVCGGMQQRRVTEVTITNQNPLTHCSGGALRIGVTIGINHVYYLQGGFLFSCRQGLGT